MRQFVENTFIALQALWANKMRSFLTLIGIIIGVTTIIAIVSLITGMNQYVAGLFADLGTNTFTISRFGIITSEEEWLKARGRKKLTLADAAAIEEYCEHCEKVAGRIYTFRKVKSGNQYLEDVFVVGFSATFPEIVDFDIEAGRFPSEEDDRHRRRVAFIGYDVIDGLYPGVSHIGKTITIGNANYTIIGNGKRRGSTLGESRDNYVVIPIRTFEKQFGRRRSVDIFILASSGAEMDDAKDDSRLILRERRGVKYNEDDDFAMLGQAELMDFWKNFSQMAFIVMVGISSIALVVGGIVVMNIMLVSVTERTREIGVRKAIGARRFNIMTQFLSEAVVLAAVGGGLGIACGILVGMLLSVFSGMPMGIELWAVLAGLGVSTSIGIVFGVYPAMKAARLDPIEALRYE